VATDKNREDLRSVHELSARLENALQSPQVAGHGLRVSGGLVSAFWTALQASDWHRVANHLARCPRATAPGPRLARTVQALDESGTTVATGGIDRAIVARQRFCEASAAASKPQNVMSGLMM
jgi:hypothetical protein